MTRLKELGISSVGATILEMGRLAEMSVLKALGFYTKGIGSKKRIFDWSKKLQILKEESETFQLSSLHGINQWRLILDSSARVWKCHMAFQDSEDIL
jgi:hypothetical protein